MPGASRPLMSPRRGLAGFEFRISESLILRASGREGAAVMRSCTAGVFSAMRLANRQGLLGLTELPREWVAAALPGETVGEGMLLALRPDGLAAAGPELAALVHALRERGVKVGWRADAVPEMAVQPDFLLLDSAAAMAVLPRPAPMLVAPELAGLEEMNACFAAGVELAGCRVGTPEPRQPRELPPASQQLLRLLHQAASGTDVRLIADTVKQDAALSLRLLQFINSAGNIAGKAFESIDQAVMWLGRDELYRWVARLLVRQAPQNPGSEALQQFALARARLMELLGRRSAEPQAGALYLTGLVSLLPAMMNCRLEEALRTVSLPEAAMQALAGGEGPWAAHLQLAIALENGDQARVREIAPAFGGPEAVAELSAQAWREAQAQAAGPAS